MQLPVLCQKEKRKHLNTPSQAQHGRTLCLAAPCRTRKSIKIFLETLQVKEGLSCSLLCNRDHYDWETIKQLAGTHFYFKTPEQPAEITYSAHILWWMFSFSICTKANYRKLLHLFILENLKGKQSRLLKNISWRERDSSSQDLPHIFQC